ncbi:MAG: response regulator [bacterium]
MRKMLIVEDDALVAMVLSRFLTRLGYTVCGPVVSGEEALEMVDREQPDGALMDVHLAGKLNGIQTVQALHAHRALPVLFVSGYPRTTLLQMGMSSGAVCLLKPVMRAELELALSDLFAQHVG